MFDKRCSTCKHYQPSPIFRKGWCRNPQLYTPRENHLVEAASLDCSRDMYDYWEPIIKISTRFRTEEIRTNLRPSGPPQPRLAKGPVSLKGKEIPLPDSRAKNQEIEEGEDWDEEEDFKPVARRRRKAAPVPVEEEEEIPASQRRRPARDLTAGFQNETLDDTEGERRARRFNAALGATKSAASPAREGLAGRRRPEEGTYAGDDAEEEVDFTARPWEKRSVRSVPWLALSGWVVALMLAGIISYSFYTAHYPPAPAPTPTVEIPTITATLVVIVPAPQFASVTPTPVPPPPTAAVPHLGTNNYAVIQNNTANNISGRYLRADHKEGAKPVLNDPLPDGTRVLITSETVDDGDWSWFQVTVVDNPSHNPDLRNKSGWLSWKSTKPNPVQFLLAIPKPDDLPLPPLSSGTPTAAPK